MVTAHLARPWVLAQMHCGEHILPAPFLCRVWILSGKRVRQVNLAGSRCQIALVQKLYSLQMCRQLRLHSRWQYGNAILESFAVAHQDLVLLEEQVLHSEPDALHQTHSCAVQEPHHETDCSRLNRCQELG